jgi:hypothetical protein
MKKKKMKKKIIVLCSVILCAWIFIITNNYAKKINNIPNTPKYVRGIHITPWSAGSHKYRNQIKDLIENTELNTIVIAVKEYNGEVYIPEVNEAKSFGAYIAAMPDIRQYLQELKQQGIYTVARIVVFKDDIVAKKKTEWAVKNTSGTVWLDNKSHAWIDPYNKDAWNYIFAICDKCVDLGFDELQFDYIRFPSDGRISQCRYMQKSSSSTAVAVIGEFLETARQRYKDMTISADVFGLTTSAEDDMGIGQSITEIAKHVDYICPMVYPSHYYKGAYNMPNPEIEAYKTVNIALQYARKKLGESSYKLRPYLQDFSLKHKYNAKEVLDQIQAGYNNDVASWTLWNPRSKYTRAVFKPKQYASTYEKTKVEISTATLSVVNSTTTAQN